MDTKQKITVLGGGLIKKGKRIFPFPATRNKFAPLQSLFLKNIPGEMERSFKQIGLFSG